MGKLRCVHVVPLGEVAYLSVPPMPTAQKTVPFHAIELFAVPAGILRWVQELKFVDVIA